MVAQKTRIAYGFRGRQIPLPKKTSYNGNNQDVSQRKEVSNEGWKGNDDNLGTF